MNPLDYLKNGTVKIWQNEFIVATTDGRIPSESVFFFKDFKETTVVLPKNALDTEGVEKVELGWKILTFDMVLPFELTGFLAAVAQVLAAEKVSIFAISSFSTDHILVKTKDLEKTIWCLEKLGCTIEYLS